MPFCTNCGQSLFENDKFCGSCGTPVKRVSNVETQTLPSQEPLRVTPKIDSKDREEITGIIDGWQTMFPTIKYILFLTDRRIIAAKKGIFESMQEAGGKTGGILGAIVGAGLDAAFNKDKSDMIDELSQMTPDEILNQDKNNHEILYDDIVSIELKNPGFLSDGQITVFTSQKRRFDLVMETDKETFRKVITIFRNNTPVEIKVK